jgi:predicted RNase H-like HicB family nuclease
LSYTWQTVKEALENLKDAVQLYLEDILEEEIIVRSLELEHEATLVNSSA